MADKVEKWLDNHGHEYVLGDGEAYNIMAMLCAALADPECNEALARAASTCDEVARLKAELSSNNKDYSRMETQLAAALRDKERLMELRLLVSRHIHADVTMEGPRYYISSIQSFGRKYAEWESNFGAAMSSQPPATKGESQ